MQIRVLNENRITIFLNIHYTIIFRFFVFGVLQFLLTTGVVRSTEQQVGFLRTLLSQPDDDVGIHAFIESKLYYFPLSNSNP